MKTIRDILVKVLEWFLIASFAVLTLDVLWGVFTRYVTGSQAVWTEELAVNLLIWVSLLGAALTYEEKGHLGVDYFVGKLHPDARRYGAVFVELVVLFFAGFGLVFGGWKLVSETLSAGQVLPALGWKKGYVYSAAPLAGVFFIIFSVEHLLEILSQKSGDAEGLEEGGEV